MKKSDPIDALLDAVPTRKRPGPMDRWLEQDPARADEFWRFLERGNRERSKSIEDLLAVWNANRPPCPISACRVRERLRERRG